MVGIQEIFWIGKQINAEQFKALGNGQILPSTGWSTDLSALLLACSVRHEY